MHQEFDFQEKCKDKEKFVISDILIDAFDCPELF